MNSRKKFYAGCCGCHKPNKYFWKIRKAKATIGGMVLDDKTRMNADNPLIIEHILRSLEDLEAYVHMIRCCGCGLAIHEGQEINTFGESWCIDCGVALIESQAEDDALRPGLAKELARQAAFKGALADSWKPDDILHPYWKRIVAAAPEVQQEFETFYAMLTR